MSVEIPHYPKPPETVDPVARSIAKPDAFAKPGTVSSGSRGMRVRLTTGDKSLKPRRKKRNHDYRDVSFY